MKALIQGLVAILAMPVVFGLWYACTTGAFIGASDVHVADSIASVRDARQVIENSRASAQSDKSGQTLRPHALPESLRLPKLKYAVVYPDHVSLVLGGNPDWSVGARVWSADSSTVHADQPTAFRDIFFFQYCNDIPTSPTNLP